MADVPEWLRDVPVPTNEQFAELDRIRSERARENEVYAMRLLVRRQIEEASPVRDAYFMGDPKL